MPVIAPFEPVISTTANKKISIHCNIKEGTPPFRIEWSKDGQAIRSSEHVRIMGEEEDSVLSIKSTKESDTGNYTCLAKNAFGSDSFTSQLAIQGKSCPDPRDHGHLAN